MICNATEGMCIAGVFGGIASGVSETTTSIFLESACFHPTWIRKTSLRHDLRTDAASRFEKGVDISNTVNVLKRAALLIKEVAGGEICGDIIDIYPNPKPKASVRIKYHYLKKLSGKNYHPDQVKKILSALGFEIVKEGLDELWVDVPYSKPDISIPADLVEEILRIDGLDSVEIPQSITISPATEQLGIKENLREKITAFLVGRGFSEIVTNSITNSRYFEQDGIAFVKMLNNLSIELDTLRPSMLETGLETIAYNINRKNNSLHLFEFGKTYHPQASGYREEEHCTLYMTGKKTEPGWRTKSVDNDFFDLKGLTIAVLKWCGLNDISIQQTEQIGYFTVKTGKQNIGFLQEVSAQKLFAFDIKQPVYQLDINFNTLVKIVEAIRVTYKEVNKFPEVTRDLALVVDRAITYQQLEKAVQQSKPAKLQSMRLFDVFESDKLGTNKKSMAVSFTFADDTKTLTDKEIDSMMQRLIGGFEKEIQAEIRK